MKYKDIRNFSQRCEEHPDHQSGMISHQMLLNRAHEEIDELREYIEQAQKPEGHQEPVAWGVDWGKVGDIPCVSIIKRFPDGGIEVMACEYAPYSYASPPQRQPMTLEKLREHWEGAKVLDMTDAEISFSDYVLIVKDVEALYGIKEKT